MSDYVPQSSRQVRFANYDEKVWEIARDKFEGNFNMAVRYLVRKALEND